MQSTESDEVLQVERTRDEHKISPEKLFLTQAKHYTRMGRSNKAFQCIESALGSLSLYRGIESSIIWNFSGNRNLAEGSHRWLLLCSRASCHLELRRWAPAVQDADDVLQNNLEIAQAFSTKIEAFYQMCLFEQVWYIIYLYIS